MSWTENIPTWQLVLLSIVGYVYLCRVLRYRRLQQKHALYPYKNREDFAKMTNQHAYEIQKYLFGVEFPFTMQKALEFALFRLALFTKHIIYLADSFGSGLMGYHLSATYWSRRSN